jgi:ABC-type multidrug transport system ATPase subunit
MIIVQNVSKRYGKFLANDGISLTVKQGELAVLLGPNGAGKSTLIKCVCGLLRFQGSVGLGGFDNRTVEAKRMLGYVPEMPVLYPLLTVYEHLEFIAKAYRLKDWKPLAEELFRRFELSDKIAKLGKELSKGMQQKVSVCCALLPKPRAIILDEPLVGLDPHGIREIKAIIEDLKNSGCALLISTHMIESIENNWDVTYILQNGRIAAVCRREELPEGQTLEDIYFSITDGDTAVGDTVEGDTVEGDAATGDPVAEDAAAGDTVAGDIPEGGAVAGEWGVDVADGKLAEGIAVKGALAEDNVVARDGAAPGDIAVPGDVGGGSEQK